MPSRSSRARPRSASERLEHLHGDRRRRAFRVAIAVVGVIVGFLITRSLVTPDPAVLDAAPSEIVGTWVTADPRYADRSFVISTTDFELRMGDDQVQSYLVREIRRLDEPGVAAYRITYVTPDGDGIHEMTLDPNGTARLRNPADVVWRRR